MICAMFNQSFVDAEAARLTLFVDSNANFGQKNTRCIEEVITLLRTFFTAKSRSRAEPRFRLGPTFSYLA